MVTLSSFVIVQQHFTKHRGMAAGIAASGISIGTLSSGPLIALLTRWFGWRGALLIFSGLTLNSCVFGSFYRPQRQYNIAKSAAGGEYGTAGKDAAVPPKGNLRELFIALFKSTFNVSIFYHISFTLICVGTFFMNAGSTIFYQHTPSRAKYAGVDHSQVRYCNVMHTLNKQYIAFKQYCYSFEKLKRFCRNDESL